MKNLILSALFFAILSLNAQTTHTVNSGGYYYLPSQLTITQGDIVEWVNDGGFHDVNGDINTITGISFGNPESFSSSPTSTVGAIIYTHQFDISGEYLYDCSVGSHALSGMVGSITVLPSSNTVADIVINSGDHNTLEAAVVAAELVETLSSTGPFTLFAPTDEAFNLLPEGTLESLLSDPTGLLADILLGHVVSGTALSSDLFDGMEIETIYGNEVIVSITDSGVMIDNAMVTSADIAADNGVVHVIDAVLLPSSNTVADIVINSGDHNTLEAAVVAAGLVETLSSTGPFTLFAPTDDAFGLLPEGTLESLLSDPTGLLTDILLGHVVSATALSNDLFDGMEIETIYGNEVIVSITDSGVMIDNAMVTSADIAADNGVVHVIDAVLLPDPECVNDDSVVESFFGNFAIITCESLVEYLSSSYNYTLEMSCAWDGMPMVDLGQSVSDICQCTCESVEDIPNENSTVVDIIVNSENHETLEAAVIAADLVTTLSGEGPFTVFAPTDDAFSALPSGTLETLLQDPDGQLTNILLHHVVSGTVMSSNLSDGMSVETVNGSSINISIDNGIVMIDNAVVTFADITADNGVVHVIDAILLPTEDTHLDERLSNDRLLFTVNLNGQIIDRPIKNTILIDVYKSGKILKRSEK